MLPYYLLDELNATISLNKSDLNLDEFDMGKIVQDQIPDEASINYIRFGLNNSMNVINTNLLMKTERSKVKRIPKRGSYDSKTIYRILDKDFICQIGFVHNEHPVVIPTIYGRRGRCAIFSWRQCQ